MGEQEKRFQRIREEFAKIGPVRLLGMEISELAPGRAVLMLDTHDGLVHEYGVHGGVLAALADTAAAAALFTELPIETGMATVEMKINFLAPHRKGRLTAEGSVLRRGRRLAVAEAEIRNSEGEKIAKSLLTFSLRSAGEKGDENRLRRHQPHAKKSDE